MARPDTFAALARRVSRGIARLERDQVCCGELTLQQFDTLRLLRDGEVATATRIAARLGIDASTASRNLAVLERGSYIARQPHASDARVISLALSSKGRACLESLACDERLLFAGLLAKVPSADRLAVVRALARLDEAITARLGDAMTGAHPCCPPAAPNPQATAEERPALPTLQRRPARIAARVKP